MKICMALLFCCVLSLPHRQLENPSSLHLQFYQCQFWKAVKLFSNILLWQGVLPGGDASIVGLAVDGLLNRYLLLALQNLPPSVKAVDKVAVVSVACVQSLLPVHVCNYFQGCVLRMSSAMCAAIPTYIYVCMFSSIISSKV